MQICIGTANFFAGYGIRNKKIENQNEIINYAVSKGIKSIDYSFLYGTLSSQFIEKIKKHSLTVHLKSSITSNFDHQIFVKNILLFNKNLNKDNIVSLSIHDPWNISEYNVDLLKNSLEIIKKELPKLQIGLSVYNKSDFKFLKRLKFIEIIQLAYNPFENDVFNYFKEIVNLDNKIKLQIRSVFMQGLLITRDIKKLQINNNLKKHHEKWIEFVDHSGYSSKEICIDFAIKSNADQIVLGLDNILHFEEILKIFKQKIIIKVPDFKIARNISDARNWTK